jgi:crotonobetainyl-CoA:carnitine CoA-transferase CaiB-like acyl-CoA transferase
MCGFTHICGDAHGTPLHLGYPISDAVGGLFGALGVLAALYRLKSDPSSQGQEIDCSVTESMLRVLEFLPIEYDQLGTIRKRSGNTSQYGAPGNVYRTRDGHWASIAASTQSIFERLCKALGREAWLTDARYCDNISRVANRGTLDKEVTAAILEWDLKELSKCLEAHDVGFSPINDIAAVFADPQLIARDAFVSVPDSELGEVRMQNVVPRFSLTPGAVRHAGPALGEHNDAIWSSLGFGTEEIAALRLASVI